MTDDFPFAGLESDPDQIAAFVADQNARTDAAFAGPDRVADVATIRAILEAPDALHALTRRGSSLYTFRQTGTHPRGLWLRLPEGTDVSAAADWETVFDLDAYSAAEGRVWVWNGAETSAYHPGRVLMRLSADGSDLVRHREFDLDTKTFVPGGFDIGPDRGGVAWADADAVLWSSAADGDATAAGWSGTVRRVQRGQDPRTAPIVLRTEPDNLLACAWVSRLGGTEPVVVHMEMPAINMTRVTLNRPQGVPVVLPHPADTSASFDHAHCAWIARQAGAHPAGSLVLHRLQTGDETVLFTPVPGAAVAAEDVFFDHGWLIWTETRALAPHIMALNLNTPGATPREIALPVTAGAAHLSVFDACDDTSDGTLTLQVSGFLTPQQIWTFQPADADRDMQWCRLYARAEQFDAQGCAVHLWHATSADGTEVPYHVVLPAGHGAQKDRPGDLPVLQYGYGGFAVSLGPTYGAIIGKTWLERGGAYVQAYIRGGGEMGPDWHQQAKGAGRRRAFDDFAAVASDLVRRGITRADRIACHGGSNGGLLCGVMLTQYPQHFGAVWASVGVHDLLRFSHFPAGRGWIDEYGDPEDPVAREWLAAFSPLHNVPDQPLPPALIATSHRDDRVDPSHSRRFAAALQDKGHKPWYYEHQGGHGGGGASHEKAAEWALGLAFLRQALKL